MRRIQIFSAMAILVLAFVLLSICVVPKMMEFRRASVEPTAIVSFTFDDANRSQYDNGLRLAKQYEVQGSLFLGPSYVTVAAQKDDRWYMTWEEVRSFHDAGWELGSHAYTHIKLSEFSKEIVSYELDRSLSEIELNVGITPVSFAPPYGDFDEDVLAMIKERYSINLRAGGRNNGRNPMDGIDPYFIERFSVGTNTQASFVCGEMAKAAQNNEWMVLMFHEIVVGEPEEYEISATTFEEILSCATFLEDRGLIRLMTVKGAVEEILPALPVNG